MHNALWPCPVVHQSGRRLNVDQGYKIDAFICMLSEPPPGTGPGTGPGTVYMHS